MPCLQNFIGQWTITRDIQDQANQLTGRFSGIGVFAPHRNGLSYHETGELSLGSAAPLFSSQKHLWYPEGDEIAVYFSDHRPFFRFDPSTENAYASHSCPPDTYALTLDFSKWPVWIAHWHVSGPHKAYQMTSQMQM